MSIMLTDLADVLRAAGLPVVEVPGWQERGSTYRGGQRDVKGIVCHHTATPDRFTGDYPTYAWIRDGGANLPGPVANLGLGRSGVWYIFAAGRANHAGPVHAHLRTTYGNGYSIGIEAENSGVSGPWPEVQYDSYARGVAALSLHYGVPYEAHKNVRPGKVDPSFNWPEFVADVDAEKAALTKPASRWTTPEGDDPAYLSEGHEHPKVAEVQAWVMGKWAWARAILGPKGIDGKYGKNTRALVATLQERLNSQAAREKWAGWTPLDVDGKWGPATEHAARAKSGFRKTTPAPKPDIEEAPVTPTPYRRYPAASKIGTDEFWAELEAIAAEEGYTVNCGPSDYKAGRCAPGKHPHSRTSRHFAGRAIDYGRNPRTGEPVSAYEQAYLSALGLRLRDLYPDMGLVLMRGPGDHEDHLHVQDKAQTTPNSFRPDLSGAPAGVILYGMHGDHVKALQQSLGVKADGVYGLQTFDALRAAQSKAGITVDGIAGPATAKVVTR